MKLKSLSTILLCTFFLAFKGKGQSLTTNEIDSVQWKIYDFLQTHEKQVYDSVNSEVIIVILQTDKNSNIVGIHLLADNNNKGLAFEMLSKMTVADFKGWNPANFSEKTIIVPVYSTGIHAKKNYADQSFWPMSWSGSIGYIVNKDQKRSILLSGIMYNPPPFQKEMGTKRN